MVDRKTLFDLKLSLADLGDFFFVYAASDSILLLLGYFLDWDGLGGKLDVCYGTVFRTENAQDMLYSEIARNLPD